MLGVIGLGAIGVQVANIATKLGMTVFGYDPFLSVDAALRLDRHIHVVKDINELYGEYQAGADFDSRPPLMDFRKDDCEPSVVYERGGAQ